MNSGETIAQLGAEILAKQTRANNLAIELTASLAIQNVWPSAFASGRTCKVMALETVRTMQQAQRDAKRGKHPALKRMWLERSDGETRELSAVEYWTLKAMPRGKS